MEFSNHSGLRDSERRKRHEKQQHDQFMSNMKTLEGMTKLTQLSTALEQNVSCYENPTFTDDSHATNQPNYKPLPSSAHTHSTVSQANTQKRSKSPHIPEYMYDNSTLPQLTSLDDAHAALQLLADNPQLGIAEDDLGDVISLLENPAFNDCLELYNTTVTESTPPIGIITKPLTDNSDQTDNLYAQPHDMNNRIHSNFNNTSALISPSIEPLTHTSDRLVNQVRSSTATVHSHEARELQDLLFKPHFQVLFPTHDELADMREGETQENVVNIEEEGSRLSGDECSDYQLIKISKTVDALGATIKNDGEAIIISRII